MKKIITKLAILSILFNFTGTINAAAKTSCTKDFIKGNITDKTSAVREANGEEGIWLSTKALEFALENKQYIGTDRDLDGLVISAILSIPADYFSKYPQQAAILMKYFIDIFKGFNDSSTVQIAVLQKITAIKDKTDIKNFTAILNEYIQNVNPGADSSLIKAVINTLEITGNRDSFVILYNLWNNKRFSAFYEDIEKALINLSAFSVNEIIQIIRSKDITQTCKVFALTQKNSKISKNLLCEISEISLSETILLVDSASKFTNEVNNLQSQCLSILEENKWTRASSIAIDYLRFCKKMFDNGVITEEYFSRVISSMKKEKDEKLSIPVVKAVINTLGAIGNKTAFDYLLAVTYLSYPDEVLSAAREALAGLRWQ